MVSAAYVNVAVPFELAKRLDRIVKLSQLGYRSRQEFVTDAVRRLVLQLEGEGGVVERR